MNKKLLKRLKQEAQVVVGEGLGGNYYDLDEDKFAELIVRECAVMARNLSPHGQHAEQAIKDHFGVE